VQQDFVPLDRSVRIGVTSGASTPDSVVQECLEQVIMLKKLGAKPAAAAAAAAATGPKGVDAKEAARRAAAEAKAKAPKPLSTAPKPKRYRTPQHTIVHRGVGDLSNTWGDKRVEASGRPREL